MSLIVKQSFSNIIIILLAFTLGALNTLFFYPRIIGAEFYGIILILLAQSNIVQPVFSFGLQHSVIKFFSSVKSKSIASPLLPIKLLSEIIACDDLIFTPSSPLEDKNSKLFIKVLEL